MHEEIEAYNSALPEVYQPVCRRLQGEIDRHLAEAESKIWHGHPVWFLEGNPIVGYSKEKKGIRLMFWSGVGFEEEALQPGTGKFKDASVWFTDEAQIDVVRLERWLEKARTIQWDYRNIVRRKGQLLRLK